MTLSDAMHLRLTELLTKLPTPQSHKADRQVFLCHGSGDKPFAKKLGDDLDRLGVTPWIDAWEIGPGDSLFSKIGSGISQAAFFCIVLSKTSVSSNWCKMELEQALSQRLLNKTHIVPFKVEDVEIPPFLGAAHYLDLKRGENREAFRLAAKIYGVSERAVDAFLDEKPDPQHSDSIEFLALAMKDYDIHLGQKVWDIMQKAFEEKGIERSDRYVIRDRHGRDHGAR